MKLGLENFGGFGERGRRETSSRFRRGGNLQGVFLEYFFRFRLNQSAIDDDSFISDGPRTCIENFRNQ